MTKILPRDTQIAIYVETEEVGGVSLSVVEEKPRLGAVVAVGPGHWNPERTQRVPHFLTPGDRVIFDDQYATNFLLDGVPHVLVEESRIVAIIKPDDEPCPF